MPASEAKALLVRGLRDQADPVFSQWGFSRTPAGLSFTRTLPAGRQRLLLHVFRDARVVDVRLDARYEIDLPGLRGAANAVLAAAGLRVVDCVLGDHVLTGRRPGRQHWLFHDDESVDRITEWMVQAVDDQARPVFDAVQDEGGFRAYAMRCVDAKETLSDAEFVVAVVAFVQVGDRDGADLIVQFHQDQWRHRVSLFDDRRIPPPPHLEVAIAYLADSDRT